ncbi:MAG: MFS transporter [Candidatus Doudnabacteria bacterium]
MQNYFHYFSHKVNREVKEVYWQTFIANLAISLVFIFEPIYLYKLGFSLISIMWFYVNVYGWYVVLIGWGAKIAGKIGYKHSIFISNIIYVAYWAALYSIRFHPKLFFLAPVFFALQKSFFWPAFDADVSLSDKKDQQGREIGLLFSIIQVTLIISPLIGGLISYFFGFFLLFALASVLMAVSSAPLFLSRDLYTRQNFRFRDLWKIFREYPSNFFGYWGYAEDLMLMSLWPVYIFIVVPQVASVGLISTTSMLLATGLMLYIGSRADIDKKVQLIKNSSLIYSLTWFGRFLAVNTPAVLIFDTLTKAAKGLLNIPMIALTYEIAGSKGTDYATAYSVFYELSLAVGKIITALGAIAILYYTKNIFYVFAFVGVLTLFYGFLKPGAARK